MGFIRRLLLALLTLAMAVLISLTFRFVPGAADFLSDFFWNFLGEIEIFSLASNILQTALGYKMAPEGQLFTTVLMLMSEALMDGLVMGCCIFALRSVFAKVNRQFQVGYPGGAWIPTGLGALLGAVILTGAGKLEAVADALISGLLCIGLMIFGIVLMLGKRPVRDYYAQKRRNNIAKMLVDILGNAAAAVCAVLMTTCVIEGPSWLAAGAPFGDWLAWLSSGFFLWFALDNILWLLTPTDCGF